MAKRQYIGKETFPTIWIWICVLFNLIGILAVVMLIIAEIIIISNDFNNYVAQYGHAYRMSASCDFVQMKLITAARGYVGDEGCGFVGWTNVPKVS